MNHPAKHPSPPLLAVSLIHLALFSAGLAAMTALAGGEIFPSPFDAERARGYFAAHASAVRVGSFFLFGSGMALGVFAATASSRLAFLGVRAAGASIALLGGVGASLCLLVSGLCLWALGQPGTAALPEALRVLHLLAFASGGPGFAATFGLLVLGVSLAGGLGGSLPRWLMWLGVAIGVSAELSSLTLLSNAALPLVPLARFSGLVWLICVGALLPVSRARAAA